MKSFAGVLVALVGLTGLAGCAADATSEEETDSNESGIVGGTTTTAYPAVGALAQFGEAFCTGTVVAPRVVVTAAHCLEGQSPSSLTFLLGSNVAKPTATLKVAGGAIHPQYDSRNIRNDIAVVRLAQDAPVTPIPMATKAPTVGQSMTFVGFGVSNGRTQTGFGIKRQVTMKVAQVGSSQFAYADAGKNTCNGDSGGPAFATDAKGALSVAGVTSYGDYTCTQYGVDTRVDTYVSFVKQAGGL